MIFKMSTKYFALSLCLLMSKGTANTASTDPYGVPGDLIPQSYELKIIPDFETFTFNGEVSIKFLVKFPTNVIAVHCDDKITIKATKVDLDFDEAGAALRHENGIVKVVMNNPLTVGLNYFLTLEFNGEMNNTERGFYKMPYKDSGEKKWLAATHFSEIYAREAFPCFDEPYFRTPFKISIARCPHQKTIAKYPNIKRKARSAKTDSKYKNIYEWDYYEISEPIPTNLVSFIIGELSSTTSQSNIVTLWTRNDLKHHSAYALQRSERALLQLQKYTGIPYELPRLDIVAIPETDEEASQNWGVTTLRENHVIVDEQKCSELQKTIVTSSLCNQISRHWVGGLVTPVNWSYSWLTNALAGYMEIIITPLVDCTLRIDEIFNVRILQPALRFETLRPRSLTFRQKNVLQSDTDDESYVIDDYKGTSIIKMFENIISKSSLRSIINEYITEGQKFQWGLASLKTFYKAFENQAQTDSFPLPPHLSITKILKTWIENAGYPLITVTRDLRNQAATINQRAFKTPQLSTSNSLFNEVWAIPITYTTKFNAKFSTTTSLIWLISDETVQIPRTIDQDEWIICNLQQTGYYRVNYDFHNWNLLIQQLKDDPQKIHYLNRAQLIDDSFSLAFDDQLSYEIPLRLAEYLQRETEILPLLSAVFHFNMLLTKYEHTRNCIYVHRYIQAILENQVERIGFEAKETDSYVTKIGRPSILSFACKVGLGNCIQGVLKVYENNIENIDKIAPDMKEVIFCTALRRSKNPQEVYDMLWRLYERSNIAYDRTIILNALGCTRNTMLLQKTLRKLIDPSNEDMTNLDRKHAYNSILSSSNGVTIVLQFIKELIPVISNLQDDAFNLLETMASHLKSKVVSELQVTTLKISLNELKRLDREKYGDFINSLNLARWAGIKRIKENNKRSETLIPIFKDILQISTSTTSNSLAPTSFATTLLPSKILYLLVASTIIILHQKSGSPHLLSSEMSVNGVCK